MREEKCYQVFILSDTKTNSVSVQNLLAEFDQYELHYIPTEVNLFDVLKYDPDVVILDSEAKKVVRCYEWELAA